MVPTFAAVAQPTVKYAKGVAILFENPFGNAYQFAADSNFALTGVAYDADSANFQDISSNLPDSILYRPYSDSAGDAYSFISKTWLQYGDTTVFSLTRDNKAIEQKKVVKK